MTLVAVPIFISAPAETDEALRRATLAAEFGADLIEWRIDRLGDDPANAAAVIDLIKRSPLPSILTCRHAAEGGEFDADDARRVQLLGAASHSGIPLRYLDFELNSFAALPLSQRQALLPEGAETSLILSTHDFTGRPPDLMQRIARMAEERACDVIKIAWTARSVRDNLEAFDLLVERAKPMIALCMGPFGLPSRVLAPKFGGLVTFAALEVESISTPGQPTLEELKIRYRFDAINEQTRVYGVFGWPVAQSLSPHVHNAGFEAVGFNGVYLPMPIPAEWEHFKATVVSLVEHPRLDFRGASITIPHKENLLRFIEERGGRMDDHARLARAANTLLVSSTGGVVCRNTDVPAILECLCEGLNISRQNLRDVRLAVLGAGGVARAAIAGLMQYDAPIAVFNRTEVRGRRLVEQMQHTAGQIESKSVITLGTPDELRNMRFDVYINTTSVGMSGGPAPGSTPFELLGVDPAPLDETVTVFETVYAPSRTPLVEEAESRGARVILGIDMFIRQASMQFEGWTGERAPIDTFRTVLKREGERARRAGRT